MPGGLVLVVDDSCDVRRTICHGLKTLGYRTAEATDAQSALTYVHEHAPAAVIVDFLLPGMDGLELACELQKMAPGMSIIFTTGYANEQRIRTAINDEIAILHKPFRLGELAVLIEAATQNA